MNKKITRIANVDERLETLRKRAELLIELRHGFLAAISAELPGVFEEKPQASADLFKWFEAKQVNSAAEKAKTRLEILDEMLSDFLAEIKLLSGNAPKHPGEKRAK